MLGGHGAITHMGNYEILLDIHEIVRADAPQLWELLSTFFEESRDIIALFALFRCSGDLGYL